MILLGKQLVMCLQILHLLTGHLKLLVSQGEEKLNPSPSGSGNTAVFDLDLISSSSDYAITWSEVYSSGGGRNGFILRGSGTNTANSGAKRGYLFQSSPILGHVRIYRSNASSYTQLGSFALAASGNGIKRWYRATSCGSTHTFSYSTDGITFTQVISVTDGTYLSGTTQYVSGYGQPINNTFVDDITAVSCAILPIELISFSAQLHEKKSILLIWQTASEINNDYFTIQRSADGKEWKEVKQIDGFGNSSVLHNYSAIDKFPYAGISYYRLKQTDFDGKFSYSQVRSVKIDKFGGSQINIYPNPTSNQITIEGDKHELEQIKIYNTLGQDVTFLTKVIENNETKVIIDLSHLSKGTYYVKTKTTANTVYSK